MANKYEIGQKVVIVPVKNRHASSRGVDIQLYAGEVGKVTDFYWISLDRGTKVFYTYTVRIKTGNKEIVVHEDELESCTV